MNKYHKVPDTKGINRVWLGILLGGFFAQGVTVSRWVTLEPYHALFVPYDWMLLLLFGVACSFCISALERHWTEIRRRTLISALLVIALSYIWGMTVLPEASWRFTRLVTISAISIAAWVCLVVWHTKHARLRGPRIEYVGLFLSAMLALSLAGTPMGNQLVYLYPFGLVAAFAGGIPRLPSRTYWPGLFSLGVAVLVTLACAFTIHPKSEQLVATASHVSARQGRSVILIVVDTLRRDHMSLYGYPRETTPHIDAWAADALVFDNATAVSSWTLPSHASMFTGLHPRSHGAHGFRNTEAAGATAHALPATVTTLAELAAGADIETAAIVSNFAFVTPRYGLHQGFHNFWVRRTVTNSIFPLSEWLAQYLTPWRYIDTQWRYYRDDHITDNVLRWLDANRSRPFFLFINYMDAHDPNAREPSDTVPRQEELPASEKLENFNYVWQYQPLDEVGRRTLVNAYDREILHLDGELQRLFEYIETSGLSKTTTLILTSDHGEYLGEHSLTTHSKDLHEEVLAVPLVIRGPFVPAGRSRVSVQSTDIFPTVLDQLGLPTPETTEGRSVVGLEENRPAVSEWYKATNSDLLNSKYQGRFDRDLRTITLDHYKLFVDDQNRVQLYNLADDPGEQSNLATSEPERTDLLRIRLDEWVESHAAAEIEPTSTDLSPENLERLRSLGYIE